MSKHGEKGTSNKTRVYGSSSNNNENDVILNHVPLQMVISFVISLDKSKSVSTKKNKSSEKASTY